PVWSPDYRQIAFVSERDGNQDIYIMDADGSNVVNLTNHPDADFWPVWSPEGNHIVFQSMRDRPKKVAQIYKTDVKGTRSVNLTSTLFHAFDPVWSPDGTHIAFVSTDGIYTMNNDGTNIVNLTNS